MNLIVCVKQVPDPEAPPASFRVEPATNKMIPAPGVKPVISPFDEYAVEAALRLKDAKGGKVSVLSLGKNLALDVVRKPLSMGADELYLLQDDAFEEGDSYSTAYALALAIKKLGAFDLIFCGRQAADWDAGQVGSGIAELLGIPSITLARKVEAVDGKARVERSLPDGFEVVEVDLPALVTVSNELGEPRYPTLKGILAAARKPVTVWKASDLGVAPAQLGRASARTQLLRLYTPEHEVFCEIIEGETPEEAGAKMALRLRQAKLL